MQIHQHPDPAQALEVLMSAILRRVFASHEASHLVGLRAIHEVASSLGMPGWYLWPHGREGAYMLELASAEPTEQGEARGLWMMRYFPHPGEPAFAHYTPEERELRLSQAFDQTGTPRFGALPQGEESLFGLGWLTLDLDPGGQAQDLVWSAPGQTDGEASAWAWGLSLADSLVSALCLHLGQGPAHAWVVEMEANGLASELDPSPSAWSQLGVAFSSGQERLPGPQAGRLMAEARGEDQAGGLLNPLWWHIARHPFPVADQAGHCCHEEG